jgi:hypothetical protein
MEERRVLDLDDVCYELDISRAQMTTVIRAGELKAVPGRGRGSWSIDAAEFEAFIERKYAETRDFIASHPYSGPLATRRDDSSTDEQA